MKRPLNPLLAVFAALASLHAGSAAFPAVAVSAATEPVPVEAAEQTAAPAAAGEIDPAVMKLGQGQFIVCGACHGQSGEGGAAGPPLAGAEWVNGPAENLIRIQLRGLIGPITIKGVEHNFPGGMQPMAYQTDEQIAAVLTYIRNSFGNQAPAVKPEEVAAHRDEVGQPQLTAADLIPPAATPEPTADTATPADTAEPSSGETTVATPARSTKYDNLSVGTGLPGWITTLVILFTLGCLVPAVVRR